MELQWRSAYAVAVAVISYLASIHAAPSIDSQTICSSGKLDLVLVVDVSGSVQRRFEANRDAALDIAHAMPIGWEKVIVAVIQYSRLAVMKLQFGTSETAEIVNDTISTLEWTGDVAYGAEAMDLAMIQFRRSRTDSDRVIILFSDGNSLNKWEEVQAASERLRYSDAKIFAVSLGGSAYEPELLSYIGKSNGSIIRTQSELAALKKELLQYTVPSCHNAPSLASKFESKHVEDSDDRSAGGKDSKTGSGSNGFTSSTTRKHRTHSSNNSTKHGHTTPSASKRTATTFTAFSKKSTTGTGSSTAATTKTAKKITTSHHTSSSSTSTTASSAATVDDETETTSTKRKPTTRTTVSASTVDPAARQEAMMKMIERKVVHL